MDASTVEQLRSRRAWLKRAEADLAERLERSFVAHGGIPHSSDPLYQRMWYALDRVKTQLSQLDAALAQRARQAA